MTLSRQDTAFLKGIAILLIVVHNFCHWLPRSVIENEYTFVADRIWQYLGYVEHGGPHLLLNFFSHFGHYGVPLFLFLSGYGLVKKYERAGATPIGVGAFLWHNAVKLWKLMIPALLLYMVGEYVLRDGFQKSWSTIPWLLSYCSNLVPATDLILGPWWFFGLIMQCYLLYRVLFLPRRSPWMLWGVVALTMLIQIVLQQTDFHFNYGGKEVYALEYYRYNAPGHLLSFALGIAAARGEIRWTRPWLTMALGWILLLTSAFSVWLWWLSPLYAVMALLPLAQLVRQPQSRALLERVGLWSAAIFAVHPIVRRHLILGAQKAVRMDEPTLVYSTILLYLLITLALAWVYERWTSRAQTLLSTSK